ncbi:helix-turn-helix domain-containing protein [Lactococcus lactis]|uniref:helix-turn-helix domain-containing protein n=1 Tax=Lactococcus lactis TaxID=1358 RepID=UPI0035BC490F
MFYQLLKEQADKCQKSLNQIEKELGYPRNALNNYRNGNIPSGVRLLEISLYFGLSPSYFLGIDKDLSKCSTNSYFLKLSKTEKIQMWKLCNNWMISKLEDE